MDVFHYYNEENFFFCGEFSAQTSVKKKKRVPFSANLAHKNKDQLWVHERSFCFKAEFPAVLLSKAIPLKTQ